MCSVEAFQREECSAQGIPPPPLTLESRASTLVCTRREERAAAPVPALMRHGFCSLVSPFDADLCGPCFLWIPPICHLIFSPAPEFMRYGLCPLFVSLGCVRACRVRRRLLATTQCGAACRTCFTRTFSSG